MIDPVVSAVKGDMHKANDVRRGLQGVVDFAEQNMCAVVGISHFVKGGAGSSPADRVIGSQAFSALARTVLVAAKQEDSDARVLARAKSNIETDEGGVSYTIEPFTIHIERLLPHGEAHGYPRAIACFLSDGNRYPAGRQHSTWLTW